LSSTSGDTGGTSHCSSSRGQTGIQGNESFVEAAQGSVSEGQIGRHALSACTWMRTNRGLQKSWLRRLGKADSEECPCSHPRQDGHHLTFICPRFKNTGRNLLGPRRSWEELDKPNWRKEEGDDSHWDTIIDY